METSQPGKLVECSHRPEAGHTETTTDIVQVMLAMRQACLILTGAIEVYLGMERSRPPKNR